MTWKNIAESYIQQPSFVVLAVLQLIGFFEQAVYLIMPLLCIEMILQGLLSWNRNKVVGICSFGVAAFVLYELLHVWLR